MESIYNTEAFKEAIRKEPTFLELAKKKVKGRPSYICPECSHGKNGDGLSRPDNSNIWHCFSCGFNGDIFEIWHKITGEPKNNNSFSSLCVVLGIENNADIKIDYNNTQSRDNGRSASNKQHNEQQITKTQKRITEQSQGSFRNYSDYYLHCHDDLSRTDGFNGIRQHIREEFRLGYDSKRNSLIIPIDNFRYVERFLNSDSKIKYLYHPKGERIPFNLECLENMEPVFLVEGERDALAILSCGFHAVAAGGGSRKPILEKLKELKKEGKEPPFIIIATDNDKAGKDQAEAWERELKAINIIYSRPLITEIYGELKDARECLEDNEQDLFLNLESVAVKNPVYIQSEMNYIDLFQKDILNPLPSIRTGFSKLDNVLGGGLNEGLYVVGAVSSLGKTTFVMQIAKQIAKEKQPVEIYSLEMSRKELTAKALSRETFIIAAENGIGTPTETALSALEIIKYGIGNYNKNRSNLLVNAFEKYKEYAENLFIKDEVEQIKPEAIRKSIELHKKFQGKTPVIIMDYLQLINWNEKDEVRQNIDKIVLELKQISKAYHVPIIIISSFNRDSYKAPVNMGAFKESGGIEYTSDVLIGLQFQGISEGKNDNEKEELLLHARKKSPRDIELVILKNRNGTSGDKISFRYFQKFNFFTED